MTIDLANYDGNATGEKASTGQFRAQTMEVGRFSPNAFGLYDMHGNVWEWCADGWRDTHNAPGDGSEVDRADGAKLLRGGSWDDPRQNCRSAVREKNSPSFTYSRIGFRVACVVAAKTVS